MDMLAKPRQFSNGMKAISIQASGRDWLILWEEDENGVAVVRFLDENSVR